MLYPLSPEQSVAKTAIANASHSDVKYFDINTVLTSLVSAILHRLADGQKIMLHIPKDRNEKALLTDILAALGLDELTITADNKSPIPEKDVINLRSILKRDVNVQAILSEVQSQAKVVSMEEAILSYFRLMDQKVLSSISLRDYAYQDIYGNREELTIDLSSILVNSTYTAEHYHGLRRVVDVASQQYDVKFDIYDTVHIISDTVWKDATKTPTAYLSELTSLKKELTNLNQQFAKVSSDILEANRALIANAAEDVRRCIVESKDQCQALLIASNYAEETPKRFPLFAKKEANTQNIAMTTMWSNLVATSIPLSKKWHQHVAAIVAPTEPNAMIAVLDGLSIPLSDHITTLTKESSKSLQRINRVNTASDQIKELDRKLTAITSEINALTVLNSTQDNNTLSFVKQIEKCRALLLQVTSAWHLLNDEHGYVTWKSFAGGLDTQKLEVLKLLRQFPTDQWVTIFDNAYKDLIIKHASSVACPVSQIAMYSSTYRAWSLSSVPGLVNRLHKSRKQASATLLASTKELYSALFKKKSLPSIGWNDIALMNRPFMQGFFPIHIVSELKNISQYDCVISLTEREADTAEDIHHLSPITQEDLDNITDSDAIFLYLNSYEYNESLAQLSGSNRLKAAKKLAKYILSLNQDAKIYQTKNANIISLLPFTDDNRFEHDLQGLGLKTIDTQSSLYDKLTESILFTDRPQYLIIKDQLINPQLHQQLAWQTHVISLFQSAGIKVLSVDTSDQLEDNDGVFSAIIDLFGNSEGDSTSSVTEQPAATTSELQI